MKSQTSPRQSSLALGHGASGRRVVIQRCQIAGFRHHEAPLVWPALQPRVPVTMTLEPLNEHDPNAVALFWKGHKLGYLPRGENFMVARLMARDRRLSARIRRLFPKAEGNQRIQVEILLH